MSTEWPAPKNRAENLAEKGPAGSEYSDPNKDTSLGTQEEMDGLKESLESDRELLASREEARSGERVPSSSVGDEHILSSAPAEDEKQAAAEQAAERALQESMQAFFEESQRNAEQQAGESNSGQEGEH